MVTVREKSVYTARPSEPHGRGWSRPSLGPGAREQDTGLRPRLPPKFSSGRIFLGSAGHGSPTMSSRCQCRCLHQAKSVSSGATRAPESAQRTRQPERASFTSHHTALLQRRWADGPSAASQHDPDRGRGDDRSGVPATTAPPAIPAMPSASGSGSASRKRSAGPRRWPVCATHGTVASP
jgi:hypothetical protein